MIWYVRKECLHELRDIARGDTRAFVTKLHEMLDQEKAFTTAGYEDTLTPETLEAFHKLIDEGVFVPVKVR